MSSPPVRTSWKQTFAPLRSKAARRFLEIIETIEDEKGQTPLKPVQNPIRHEINGILCWLELLVRIMAGEVVLTLDKEGKMRPEFAANDHAMICHWLNRALHRLRAAGKPSGLCSTKVSASPEISRSRLRATSWTAGPNHLVTPRWLRASTNEDSSTSDRERHVKPWYWKPADIRVCSERY